MTGHSITGHICVVQFVHSAIRTDVTLTTRTRVAQGPARLNICKSSLCLKESSHLLRCMSHPWLFSHATPSMSTSSSSPIEPTTQQEHSVHLVHLQALPVDKLRHQESFWREDMQSGGNPRTATPTGHDPNELATISRIEAYSGDPYQFFDVQESFGEEDDHRAPFAAEVEEFGKLDSKLSEMSYIQSLMHFDDSVESTADSDLEDGELQKMLSLPLFAQRASGKPDAMVVQERKISAQYTQADFNESLRSQSSGGQKASGKPDAMFSSGQGNLIKSSVFRNANPSNLKGSLLEGNEDHLLNQARSHLSKQDLHVESLNKCIGELQRQAESQRLELQDAQH